MDAKSYLGTIIADSYELLSVAGIGGMGAVFKAKQTGLERTVAIKILDSDLDQNGDMVKRFAREAKSIAQLSHVHIAGFYSYGLIDDSLPYMAMEWLEGRSLLELLQNDRRLSGERTARIAMQIASGLAYAHNAGIIHRDLKPANIILIDRPEPDFVKIVDFGLARITADNSDSLAQKLTRTGTVVGTPQYLSPEQCLGNKADARSDIYSLACIMYEMICAVPPFVSDNPLTLIHKHINESVVAVSEKAQSALPPGIELIVMKCLAKNPDDRYQEMSSLQADLQSIVAGQGAEVEQRLKGTLGRIPSRNIRTGVIAVLVAIAVACIALLLCLLSDAGITTTAELLLKRDNTDKNLIYWQEVSEDYRKKGKVNISEQINLAIERALNIDAMEQKQAMRRCLSLSERFLKKNDKQSAFRYALHALKIAEALGNRRQDRTEEVVAFSEIIVSILTRCEKQLNEKQSALVFSVASTLANAASLQNSDALSRFALGPLCLQEVAGKAQMVICINNRDIVLAKRGKLEELRNILKEDIIKLDSLHRKDSTRGGAFLLSRVAEELGKRAQKKEAMFYLDECQKLIANSPRTIDDANLANVWSVNAETCLRLGEKAKALALARIAGFRGLIDEDSARNQLVLANALFANGDFDNAEKIVQETLVFLDSLKKHKLGGQMFTEYRHLSDQQIKTRSLAASILYKIRLQKKQKVQARAMLQEDIRLLSKHLPQSRAAIDSLNSLLNQSAE